MSYFACHFSFDVGDFIESSYRKKVREKRQLIDI